MKITDAYSLHPDKFLEWGHIVDNTGVSIDRLAPTLGVKYIM